MKVIGTDIIRNCSTIYLLSSYVVGAIFAMCIEAEIAVILCMDFEAEWTWNIEAHKQAHKHKHSFLGMKFCLDSFAVAALNHHHPHYSAHVGAAAEFQVKLRTTQQASAAAAAAAWALSSFRYSFSRRSSRATPPSSGFAKQNWNFISWCPSLALLYVPFHYLLTKIC